MRWSQLFGFLAAGAAIRCGPLIGVDDLQEVTCVTTCDEGAAGASSPGASGATSTLVGTSTSATSGSAGSLVTRRRLRPREARVEVRRARPDRARAARA